MSCELMTDAYRDLVVQTFEQQIRALDFDTEVELHLGYHWIDADGHRFEPRYDELDCGVTVVSGYADRDEARRVCRELHVDTIVGNMRSQIYGAPAGWQHTCIDGTPTRVRLELFTLLIQQR